MGEDPRWSDLPDLVRRAFRKPEIAGGPRSNAIAPENSAPDSVRKSANEAISGNASDTTSGVREPCISIWPCREMGNAARRSVGKGGDEPRNGTHRRYPT